MEIDLKITNSDIEKRWGRSFPIALNYDSTKIYSKIGEYVYYPDDDTVYEVIKRNDIAGISPPTAPDFFSKLEKRLEDCFVSDEDLQDVVDMSQIGFAWHAFKFATLSDGVTIDETHREFRQAKSTMFDLIAFYIVEEIYLRKQGVGAIAKFTESTRNQSHMSNTRPVPDKVSRSILFSRFMHNTYGQRYISTIYYKVGGVYGVLSNGCEN